MKTAKKAALGALAASLMAFAAPMTAAHADTGDTLKGGCSFNTDQNTNVENGQNVGQISDLSVTQEASGAPSAATVDCWIDVNGSEQAGTRIEATGTGLQANAAQIAFTAGPTDAVTLCQQVTFPASDGTNWVGPDGKNPYCPAATTIQIPPQAVIDALNGVFNTLNGVLSSTVDPAICPVLKGLGPQSIAGGLITIGTDGDVSVNDPLTLVGKVYDCPPYDPPPPGA